MRFFLGGAALAILGFVVACARSSEDGPAHGSEESPILNGTPSSRPEVVMLTKKGKQSCSGTLIAPDIVLTAGHCVDTPGTDAIYVGYSFASKDADQKLDEVDAGPYQKIKIVETALMPGFEDNSTCPMTGADVALLRLEKRVEGIDYARIADESPQIGQECVVVGYGRHNADEDAATIESEVLDWSFNEQRAARVKITAKDSADAFSAQGIDGAHSRGDSGGPIFCGNALAGTVSCSADRTKSVLELRKTYGDLQAARKFIETTIQTWRAAQAPADAGTDDAGAPDAGAD